jgi:CPA2 family monovalent cation:H+ antiporter-2
VATARECALQVPIVVRAATQDGVAQLFALGATRVIHPELEGGLAMVQQTLTLLDYPEEDVQNYTETVRQERYELPTLSAAEQQALTQMHTSPQRELRRRRGDDPSAI